ncbi:sel1 repeat family protein [Streptomyces sp. NPDC088812]|uniref:sel1 repeat family protein n=1 Tax=Streptomyces sp. NPDC088812 TaxID=3365905 RepID=UPI003817B945
MEPEQEEGAAGRAAGPAGDHVDFRHATFHAPVIGTQYTYAPPSPAPVAPADTWPRLRAVRRLTLGIRPARRFGEEPPLPPYVRRDVDDALDRIVRDRLRTGGLAVVTGEALSGKSRTAWAALRRAGGAGARVHIAQPGADLRGLPAALRGRDRSCHHVLWLDDLEGHLGAEGLTAGLLAECVHESVLVLATMRDDAYDAHRFGDGPTARVLSGAPTAGLSCRWSAAELTRLAGAADPRLADARRYRGALGVTRFLAVGPELWEEWRRAGRPGAQPGGHLLVRLAVDLARCGLTAAVPLAEFERRTARSFPASDLDWAARPRLGVVGLLVRGEQAGTWRASGPLVADALRSSELPPPGPDLWSFAAETAQEHGPDDFDAVVRAGRAALREWAEADDEYAVWSLADLAALAGDDTDARFWYRRLAELVPRLAQPFAEYLLGRGEDDEAVHYLMKAAGAGHERAVHDLGPLLLARAEHWLARSAEAGSTSAAAQLTALRAALDGDRATVEE